MEIKNIVRYFSEIIIIITINTMLLTL